MELTVPDGLFIPTRLNCLPVVQPVNEACDKFVADDKRLKVCAGLRYSSQKGAEDLEAGTAPWGSWVTGTDEGDGFVKVGHRFLPIALNGYRVLVPRCPNESRASVAAACTTAPRGGVKATTVAAKKSGGLAAKKRDRGSFLSADRDARAAAQAAAAKVDQALFSIAEEAQTERVVLRGAEIDAENLRWFALSVLRIATRASHWIEAWVQLNLPEDRRQEVGRCLVAVLLDLAVSDSLVTMHSAADAVAWLSKAQRLKLTIVEDVLAECWSGAEGRCPQAHQFVSRLLFQWFPRPKDCSWGWSRVGWSWREWWRLVEKVLGQLPPSAAFYALRGALEHMQDAETLPIYEQEAWTQEPHRLVTLTEKVTALRSEAMWEKAPEVMPELGAEAEVGIAEQLGAALEAALGGVPDPLLVPKVVEIVDDAACEASEVGAPQASGDVATAVSAGQPGASSCRAS